MSSPHWRQAINDHDDLNDDSSVVLDEHYHSDDSHISDINPNEEPCAHQALSHLAVLNWSSSSEDDNDHDLKDKKEEIDHSVSFNISDFHEETDPTVEFIVFVNLEQDICQKQEVQQDLIGDIVTLESGMSNQKFIKATPHMY